MKKSTLLSLVTAGAVIATSAGTFAVWDTTVDSATGKVTFDKPLVVELTDANFTQDVREKGDSVPTATATFPLNVDGVTADVANEYKIVLSAKIGNDNVMEDKDISLVSGTSEYNETITITAPSTATDGTEKTVTVTATLTKK